MSSIIKIDGSYGEGGGQIFRNSLAYASVVRKPVHIFNIRAKRKNPGLRSQHLTVLKALAKITEARVQGASVGSKEVIFKPKKLCGGKYKFDVGTAGSISLVLQGIIPPLLFANSESEVEIRGGTDVRWAPPIDAIRYVLIPAIRRIGGNVEIEVIRRGHYPKGGGIVRVKVTPTMSLRSIEIMEQGKIEIILGLSHCVKLPHHVAERQARSAKQVLESAGYKSKIDIETYDPRKDPHLGPGSGIVLWTKTSANALLEADALGERGKPAENVGREAAEKLLSQIKLGGAVDVHHTDQLIIFMALAEGTSRIRSCQISLHTLTAIYIAQKIIRAKFRVNGNLNESGIIEAEGIGLRR